MANAMKPPGVLIRIRHNLLLLPALLAALLTVGLGEGGCAWKVFFAEEEAAPLPATLEGLRAAIEEERMKLIDLVSQPDTRSIKNKEQQDQMVVAVDRITALQEALSALEPPTAP